MVASYYYMPLLYQTSIFFQIHYLTGSRLIVDLKKKTKCKITKHLLSDECQQCF